MYKRRGRDFYIQEIYPNIDKKNPIVFTGDTAMVLNGYSVSGIYIPDVLTDAIELKGLRLAGYVNYCYVPEVGVKHYVKHFMDNEMILLPIPERAIVENIKYKLEFVDEGYFCDALDRYQHSNSMNYELLKEVANHFNVSMEQIDYWLEESSDYNSY